jgi:hypothetical protein
MAMKEHRDSDRVLPFLFSKKVDFSSAVGEADAQEVDTLLAGKRGVG